MGLLVLFLTTAFPHFKIRGGGKGDRKWIHLGDDDTYLALNETTQTQTPQDKTFHNICKIGADIVEICSHRFYLQTCKELQLTPRGLESNVHLSTRKPSPNLKNLFKDLSTSYSNAIVDLIIGSREYSS